MAGNIEYEVAGKRVIVSAGDTLFIGDGAIHAARNVGQGPAAELATYVLRKGEPLTILVE